ncbi:MAG: alkylmercury lyase family protein [candidate division NC10 bacterium]|nr:alkylmercury lyase family protein [candidate division NC10 bacterium]
MPLPNGIRTVADRLRAAHLTKQEDRLRRRVLRNFASGATPKLATLAEQSRIPPVQIQQILRRLASRDLLVLDTRGNTVLAAYPFSATPTPHRVHLSGREVFALCAVDALGITAMLNEDARISSRCAHCGSAVEVQAQPESVTRYLPLETVVWFPTSEEDDSCPVAESRCPNISFFCSNDHLDAWRMGREEPSGVALSLNEAFEAGREIFGSLLAEPSTQYTRRTSWPSR